MKTPEERSREIERDNQPAITGMRVRSNDGHDVGKVVKVDRYGVTIQIGVLRRELRLTFADIVAVHDGGIELRSSKRALIDAGEGGVAHP